MAEMPPAILWAVIVSSEPHRDYDWPRLLWHLFSLYTYHHARLPPHQFPIYSFPLTGCGGLILNNYNSEFSLLVSAIGQRRLEMAVFKWWDDAYSVKIMFQPPWRPNILHQQYLCYWEHLMNFWGHWLPRLRERVNRISVPCIPEKWGLRSFYRQSCCIEQGGIHWGHWWPELRSSVV